MKLINKKKIRHNIEKERDFFYIEKKIDIAKSKWTDLFSC